MRTLLAALVTSVIFAGCAADPVAAPEGQADHGFTRGADDQAVPADRSSLRDFAPAQGFDRSEADFGPAQTNDFCSGSCDANTCSCYGTLDCCLAGCRACWQVLDS
jgi:hypothetical protein